MVMRLLLSKMSVRPRAVFRLGRRRLRQVLGIDPVHHVELVCPTVRLGSEYGGWTIRPDRLESSSIVYSFGVGEDVSFDLALIARFGATIHAFDPTPRSSAWVMAQRLPSAFVFHEWGIANFDGLTTFY